MPFDPFTATNTRSQACTILVVEDDQFVREVTTCILERALFLILPAANAHEAVENYSASQRHIDLLMSDMVLPGKTGLQLGQELRQFSPTLPLLLTSGYAHLSNTIEVPESGIYFIAKPYSARALVAKVESILSVPAACAARAG
jgi:DNA-binding NtrC family response regulator